MRHHRRIRLLSEQAAQAEALPPLTLAMMAPTRLLWELQQQAVGAVAAA
jgi:hypothetical protein